MRRVFLSAILFLFATEIVAFSQKSFSINIATTLDSYGNFNVNGNTVSTKYAGFRVSPDWRFPKQWGLRFDLGTAWAFTANTTGSWEKPMHSTCNVGIALAPYYEFLKNKCYFDIGVVVGCRVRLPYMNMEPAKYIQTVSVGLGLDFRFGYKFATQWSVFGDINAQRTVYDLLAKTYYPMEHYNSGCINASVGVGYKFK